MSSKWMNRMHALVPMTWQEERVEEVLLQYGITRLTHAAFPVAGRAYVVDFYLPNTQTVIECWQSASRRGVALTWVEKNACYIDWKFRRIKSVNPAIRCVALVEVGQAGEEQVKQHVGPVMEHADAVCYSMEELASVVRVTGWCGAL
ncbi:MAG TPA: hypothetical protein VGR56_00870 [Nitrososphaerales archaeon]|nr:hypothetical protein [Nitrososphaerales archaeon]